jgi:hypothetical protein
MSRCKHCDQELERRPGGRRKEYCDDACRQAAHRARLQDASAAAARQEVATWGDFQAATIEQLAGHLVAGSRETAKKLADIILAEQLAAKQDRYELQAQIALVESRLNTAEREREHRQLEEAQRAAEAEKAAAQSSTPNDEAQRAELAQLLLTKAKEQQYPVLRLSGYVRLFGDSIAGDLSDILAGRSAWQRAAATLGTQELLIAITSLQARHALEEQRSVASEQAWRDHLTQERLERELEQSRQTAAPATGTDQGEQIAELHRQLEEAQRGSWESQERFRQYVATTNKRLEQMSGELAHFRQEQERGDLPDNLAKMAKMRSQIAELESKLRWQEEEIVTRQVVTKET